MYKFVVSRQLQLTMIRCRLLAVLKIKHIEKIKIRLSGQWRMGGEIWCNSGAR